MDRHLAVHVDVVLLLVANWTNPTHHQSLRTPNDSPLVTVIVTPPHQFLFTCACTQSALRTFVQKTVVALALCDRTTTHLGHVRMGIISQFLVNGHQPLGERFHGGVQFAAMDTPHNRLQLMDWNPLAHAWLFRKLLRPFKMSSHVSSGHSILRSKYRINLHPNQLRHIMLRMGKGNSALQPCHNCNSMFVGCAKIRAATSFGIGKLKLTAVYAIQYHQTSILH